MKTLLMTIVSVFIIVVNTPYAMAGYSQFYNVDWIRTADGGWISFRNANDSKFSESECPNAVEIRWSQDSKSDYYKRVFSTLLTAKTTRSQVRWWNCSCSPDGTVLNACDIEMK